MISKNSMTCFLLVILSTSLLHASASEVYLFNDSKLLLNGSHSSYGGQFTAGVPYLVNVTSTQAIDLIVVDAENYRMYENNATTGIDPGISYYQEYSYFNIYNKTYEITVQSVTTLHIIIENSNFIDGGVNSSSNTGITFQVTYDDEHPAFDASGFTFLVAIPTFFGIIAFLRRKTITQQLV